jgi:hypothetical protein
MLRQRFWTLFRAAIVLLGACRGKPAGEAAPGTATKIDWGRETTATEIIAMARKGGIREIQWYVMPNVLRAEASDGMVFHINNANKGIDLRGMLIAAGVRMGEGGVVFRHVF